MPSASRHGVVVIDKPRGPTSHDVVRRLRRALGTREIGHAGTLDPMATGVLVVAVGEATKLAMYMTAADKAYEATLVLGVATDTLDAEGTPTERVPVRDDVREALGSWASTDTLPAALEGAFLAERARTMQTPPAFSAIKTDGERAYALARRGEPRDLAPRPVTLRAIALLAAGAHPEPWMTVALEVSKGYYVRAFARDLARELGTVGHLTALSRTRSGCFTLAEATPLDASPDEIAARVLPLDRAAARALPAAQLTAVGARDARFGRAVHAEDLEGTAVGVAAWFDPDGRLVAVGERAPDGGGRVVRGFGG